MRARAREPTSDNVPHAGQPRMVNLPVQGVGFAVALGSLPVHLPK